MIKKSYRKNYKFLCISDIDILNNMNMETLKDRFKDVDFIMSAGDVSNYYLDYLVSVLNKDMIYVNGNHVYHKDYPIPFAKNIDGKFINYKGLRILGLDGSKVYSYPVTNPSSSSLHHFNVTSLSRRSSPNRIMVSVTK